MTPDRGSGRMLYGMEYDIKDSTVELIGSHIDAQVKYNSAETEPAWNNGKVGRVAGLYVWRIEQFEVLAWPRSQYGQFYDSASFIVLQSYPVPTNKARFGDEEEKEEERDDDDDHDDHGLAHNVFFWLGTRTSRGDAGTAAYKTAELNEFLQGRAVQHREIQAAPSDEFLALFPRMYIRMGSPRSGLPVGSATAIPKDDKAGASHKKPRALFRIFRNPLGTINGIVVHEVEPTWRSLDDGDVFVLDMGVKLWVWQGKKCSPVNKGRAAQIVHNMAWFKHAEVEVLSQWDYRAKRIVDLLGADEATPQSGFRAKRPLESGNRWHSTNSNSNSKTRARKLFRLRCPKNQHNFDIVKEGGPITLDDLRHDDILLLDDGSRAVWVWEGRAASASQWKWWFRVAQAYVQHLQTRESYEDAYLTPLARVVQGNESQAFLKAIATSETELRPSSSSSSSQGFNWTPERPSTSHLRFPRRNTALSSRRLSCISSST